MLAVAQGHELVAMANLAPPSASSLDMDSWMYQTVGHEAVEACAACVGVPMFRARTRGRARETRLAYREVAGDEVEDLLELLKLVQRSLPEGRSIDAVSSGALASDYQRTRVERVAGRLGLVSLSYMWHQPQEALLDGMLAGGVDAVLVKVAAAGLTRADLGRPLAALRPKLRRLCRLYGSSVCGEGGEYESLVLDCPLFAKGKIEILQSHVVEEDEGAADMGRVARLRIDAYRVVAKRTGGGGGKDKGEDAVQEDQAEEENAVLSEASSAASLTPAVDGPAPRRDADGVLVLPPGDIIWLDQSEVEDAGASSVGKPDAKIENADATSSPTVSVTAQGATTNPATTPPSPTSSPSPLAALPAPFVITSGAWKTADGSIAAWAQIHADLLELSAASPLGPSSVGSSGNLPPSVVSPPSTLAALSAPAAFSSAVVPPSPPPAPLDTAPAVAHLLAAVRRRLASLSVDYGDATAVRLFVPSMASFAAANAVYGAALPAAEPPTRACVEGAPGPGLLGSAAVEVLCRTLRPGTHKAQARIGNTAETATEEATRVDAAALASGAEEEKVEAAGSTISAPDAVGDATAASPLPPSPSSSALPPWYLHARSGLHVQSVSSWAPACIGPYAQAARGPPGLVFYAGQIALDPSSMAIVPGGARAELERCWTSCRAVSVALGAPFDDALLFLTVHVADALAEVERSDAFEEVLRKVRGAGRGGATGSWGGANAAGSRDDDGQSGDDAASSSDSGSANPFLMSPAYDAMGGSASAPIPPDDYLVPIAAPKRRYDAPVLVLSQPQLPKSALVELEPVLWDAAEPADASADSSASADAQPEWRRRLCRTDDQEEMIEEHVAADGIAVTSRPLATLRSSTLASPGRLVRILVGVRLPSPPKAAPAPSTSEDAQNILARAFSRAAEALAASGLDPRIDVAAARAYPTPLAASIPGLDDPRLIRRAAKKVGFEGVSLVVPVGGAWVQGEGTGDAVAIEVLATRA